MSKHKIKLRHDDVRVADLETDGHKIQWEEYQEQLDALQLKMQKIMRAYLFTGDRAVIVFEGVDAAGKGGTIRRLTSVLDPRAYKVWPIGAPNEIERAQHYLTRFWSRLPPPGLLAIFDRSWYGRVLVERVEGFATKKEWHRAYREINEFEQMLIEDGVRLIKIFLHISAEEQLERFRQRAHDPMKRWKLTLEDVRNRDKWDVYEAAIDDMIEKTSTMAAPWRVIATNHKKLARIQALTEIADRLADGVDLKPRPMSDSVRKALQESLGIDTG